MNKWTYRTLMFGAALTAFSFASCNKDDKNDDGTPPEEDTRWITLSGALMQNEAGDGNGGTMVYSITPEEARNPNFSVNVFDNGTHVKSSRTARLQASEDGKFLYNIQYTGADGGMFNKYQVTGGNKYTEVGSQVNTAPYVGTSPRWAKVSEGVGVAVDVTAITNIFDGEGDDAVYKATRGTARIVVLDLNDPKIINTRDFEIPLTEEEEKQGYHIYRLDAPVLNKAGNKLLVGTWMRKYKPGTTTTDAGAARLGTKTLVVDYPSLENPKIISSTVATGDNSGYRSPMTYAAEDGNLFQGTHRELAGAGGSQILKINGTTLEYDNTYKLNLDAALGVTDSYIESWRYVGNGIGYVIYSVQADGARKGGYVARVDLNNRTATKMTLPNEDNLDFGQYQGIAKNGDEVYIAVTGIGQDGNIYIFNSKTGTMNTGAKLINKSGNRYIGVY